MYYVLPKSTKITLEGVYYNLEAYRNQVIDLALSKPLQNTCKGVYHNEQIYRNHVIGHVLPKFIKTAEKDFIIMEKHKNQVTTYCQSPNKTPGIEFIIMNEYIETRSLAM